MVYTHFIIILEVSFGETYPGATTPTAAAHKVTTPEISPWFVQDKVSSDWVENYFVFCYSELKKQWNLTWDDRIVWPISKFLKTFNLLMLLILYKMAIYLSLMKTCEARLDRSKVLPLFFMFQKSKMYCASTPNAYILKW